MDFIRLTISCLTGIGALALGTTVIVVIYAVRVMRRFERSRPPDASGDFTPEQVERLTQLKYRYETEVNR